MRTQSDTPGTRLVSATAKFHIRGTANQSEMMMARGGRLTGFAVRNVG